MPLIAQISAGGDDTYALGRDGTLWAWGAGSYGHIGNTAAGNTATTPSKVNLAGVKSVAAGGTHALAVTTGADLPERQDRHPAAMTPPGD